MGEECAREIESQLINIDHEVVEKCDVKKAQKQQYFKQQQQTRQQATQQQQQVRSQQQDQQQQQQQQQQQIEEEYDVCISERQVCEVKKQRCVKKLRSEGQDKKAAKKFCKDLRFKCQKKHEVRQQLKQTLKKVDEGHALTASFSVILSGEERRAFEGSVTAGEKITKLGRE